MKGEKAVADFQTMFERGQDLPVDAGTDDKAVNNRLNPRMFIFAELEMASQIVRRPIDPHAPVPLQANLLENMFPVLTENLEDRRANFHLSATRQAQQVLEHLLQRARRDGLFAART